MVKEYHVALSFAGEDRSYVEQVADQLQTLGIRVFYDKFEEVDLWGKDLYSHLSDVYKTKAEFTVMFISRHYREKLWTKRERESAQARAFQESREYVLPVRFDDTEIPGLLETVAYLDLRTRGPSALAEAICEKLNRAGLAIGSPLSGPTSRVTPAQSDAWVTVRLETIDGKAIIDSEVRFVDTLGATTSAISNNEGNARMRVPKRGEFTVLCAHPRHSAYSLDRFSSKQDLIITFPTEGGSGSLISEGGLTTIPGLSESIYFGSYIDGKVCVVPGNMAMNGEYINAGYYEIDTDIHLKDFRNNSTYLRICKIIGKNILVEYILQ